MGSHRVGHDWSHLAAAAAVHVYACVLPLGTLRRKATEEKLETTGVRDTKKRKFQLFEWKLKNKSDARVLLNV